MLKSNFSLVGWLEGQCGLWQTHVNSTNENLKTRNFRRNNLIKSPWTRNVGIDWLLLLFLYRKNHQTPGWYIAEGFCNVSPFHEDSEFGHHHFPLVNCWVGMSAIDGKGVRRAFSKIHIPCGCKTNHMIYPDMMTISELKITKFNQLDHDTSLLKVLSWVFLPPQNRSSFKAVPMVSILETSYPTFGFPDTTTLVKPKRCTLATKAWHHGIRRYRGFPHLKIFIPMK